MELYLMTCLPMAFLLQLRDARDLLTSPCYVRAFFTIFASEEKLPRRAPKEAVCFVRSLRGNVSLPSIRTMVPSFLCVVMMVQKGEMAPVNRTEETVERMFMDQEKDSVLT
jgi:hypothetical protein